MLILPCYTEKVPLCGEKRGLEEEKKKENVYNVTPGPIQVE
jgi:hypothetical protein